MHCSLDAMRLDAALARKITLGFLLALLTALNIAATLFNFDCKSQLQNLYEQQQRTAVLINNIAAQVQQLNTDFQKNRSLTNQQESLISHQLTQLQMTITQLPNHNQLQQIETQLMQLQQQMNIKNKSKSLRCVHKKRKRPHHAFKRYLALDILPFTVTGVNEWNGYAIVEIDMNGRDEYIAKNAVCNGWKVIDISFEPAQVVLQNMYGQHKIVTVRLT